MTSPAGGLGRGLSTILTGASTAPASRGSTTDQVVERALTEMASWGPLRVCGHLDDPTGAADLVLRSPDLGSLHPTEAYQLFSALSSVDVEAPGRHDLDIGSHRAKTLEDLEDTNFDLAITLAPEAHHRVLDLTRTQALEVEYWPTADPTIATGSREQILQSYRLVRASLPKKRQAELPAVPEN